MDLTVDPQRPIILIGGVNGGGKTTLFEAIYGALYGLVIKTEKEFIERFNAGNLEKRYTDDIFLEIKFSGLILGKEQKYILSRTYRLNESHQPVESVRLNLNGDIFTYGTHTPVANRQVAEKEINRIIKANLPQELSRYFLFDATETKNLLEENQLAKVIKENIENVMGFNKFQQLAKSSEKIAEIKAAEKIKIEKDRNDYLSLLEEKKILNEIKQQIADELGRRLDFSIENKQTYSDLFMGHKEETTLKSKISQLEQKLSNVKNREGNYKDNLESFVRDFDLNVMLPKLVKELRSELSRIINERKDYNQTALNDFDPERVRDVVKEVVEILQKRGVLHGEISVDEVLDEMRKQGETEPSTVPHDYLDPIEFSSLEKFMNRQERNGFSVLHSQKIDIEIAVQEYEGNKLTLENLKESLTGNDYSFLREYEANEQKIADLEKQKSENENKLRLNETTIGKYDLHDPDDNDPKFEAVKKLKDLFYKISDTLLKAKRTRIEVRLKEDLNINLLPYRNQITRVEFGESIQNFSFTIFHNRGNVIPLGQLNAASKQMVVQCLLKALHEFGDYDPPVMIDTVMGALDRESRKTVLEFYFPKLAHQTILFSSDTEITPENDYPKIAAFVSKTYTLRRIPDEQRSSVENNYFSLDHEVNK